MKATSAIATLGLVLALAPGEGHARNRQQSITQGPNSVQWQQDTRGKPTLSEKAIAATQRVA